MPSPTEDHAHYAKLFTVNLAAILARAAQAVVEGRHATRAAVPTR
jgi:hypothetical protein